MTMKLKIPFYENKGDGNQCMQVSMKSVLKHFLGKDFSLRKLDNLTGRTKGKWTWTTQIVPVLYELGLEVKYFSKQDYWIFSNKASIRKLYGKSAGMAIKLTNMKSLKDSINKMKRYDLFEKKKLSFKSIENKIKNGNVPLMLIDWNKLNKINGLYQGHFVVVTGFNAKNVYYHESGPINPKPNKRVLKKDFISAWNANGTDNDVVIVSGRRSK